MASALREQSLHHVPGAVRDQVGSRAEACALDRGPWGQSHLHIACCMAFRGSSPAHLGSSMGCGDTAETDSPGEVRETQKVWGTGQRREGSVLTPTHDQLPYTCLRRWVEMPHRHCGIRLAV